MKVVAFNGSARKDGNTAMLIAKVFAPLQAAGVETEMIQLGTEQIRGCVACYQCFENKNKKCNIGEIDMINYYIEKIIRADVLIIASPTYFADVTANMKAFIERCGMVSRANNNLFKRKLGAAIVSVRRAGAIQTFETLNNFFLILEMIVVGSSYWNIGIGRAPGDVLEDQEGLQTMQALGENILWLLNKVK